MCIKKRGFMKPQELTEKLKDLFENNKTVNTEIQLGGKHCIVSFKDILSYDLDLAEEIIRNPEAMLTLSEEIIKEMTEKKKPLRIRDFESIELNKIKIRDIRTENLEKMYSIQGVIRQTSDVRPFIIKTIHECPSCGNVLTIKQLSRTIINPTKCGCGREGKFHLIEKESIDVQKIVLWEDFETLEGEQQPKRLNVILKGTLTSPDIEFIHTPGKRVITTGIIKEMPKYTKTGESVERDIYFEANYIKPLETDFSLILVDDDVRKIKDFSKSENLMEKFIQGYAPDLYGMNEIKESIILHLFGGSTRQTNLRKEKGEIHVLLVGDTGKGKTSLARYISKFAPKSIFVVGTRASGAGISAIVQKDEFTGGWMLEAGALVLAHKGILVIDEIDKLEDEGRKHLLESLSEGTITVTKAIQSKLIADTSVIGIANPKHGRFDIYEDLSKQIDMRPELLNRFDLVFAVTDTINKEQDEKVADSILDRRSGLIKDMIDYGFVKKYVFYAKQNIHPELSDSVKKKIKELYVETRQKKQSSTGEKTIPITPRQVETLIKLTEASARMRLSNKTTIEDFDRAERIVMFSLNQLALDPETGTLDIDKIEIGVSTKSRNKLINILSIIDELSNKIGKVIPLDDIIIEAKKFDIAEAEAEEIIQKLKTKGDLFEPRRGFISKL